MSNWLNNYVGAAEFTVDIETDNDDGVFLSLTVYNEQGVAVDLHITDGFDALTFFDDVARAKADWERMTKEAR